MNGKKDASVRIHGKEYVICGYESTEYLERIASYLNKKAGALKCGEGYNTLDRDLRAVLLDINIADDYFKARDQIAELEHDRNKNRNEIYDLKHEAVVKTTELEHLQQKYLELEQKLQEAEIRIVELKCQTRER